MSYESMSTRQLAFVVATSRMATSTVFLAVLTSGNAGRDAWISALIATGIALVFSLFLHLVSTGFRSESIAEYATRVLGRQFGALTVVPLAILFAFIFWVRIRVFLLLISVTALPKTPGWVISSLTLFLAVFLAWRGVAAIGRSSEVAFTLVAGSLLLILGLGMLSEFEFRWLLPILENGWRPVLGATVSPLFWFAASSSYALVFHPHLTRPRGVGLALIIANGVAGLALAAVAAWVVSSLGPIEAAGMMSPLYGVMRNVRFGLAIRRLEILAMALWVIPIILDTAVTLWCTARLLGGITGLQTRHMVLAAGLLLFGPVVAAVPSPLRIRSLLSPQLLGSITLAVPVGLTLTLWLIGKARGWKGGRTKSK